MQIDGSLEEWLRGRDSSEFPRGNHYPDWYVSIADDFRNVYHTEVDRSALLKEIEDGSLTLEQIDFLTHHGEEHVRLVMDRVADLLRGSDCDLSAYEVYLLLIAIHLHDIGNIYGRDRHVLDCRRIVLALGNKLGDDMAEKKTIVEIAQAHGPAPGASKDTISSLEPVRRVGGKDIRCRLLAALIRFADELAEDKSRASLFLFKEGIPPKRSEVYHYYAGCLEVAVRKKDIFLDFCMTPEIAMSQYGKGDSTTFLVDEIIERTAKTHRERLYCSRFLREHKIDIEQIVVSIDVVLANSFERIDNINYKLVDAGYPEISTDEIRTLCGIEITGAEFSEAIKVKVGAGVS